MSDDRRTTKYVTVQIKATFHGDYLAADEVAGALGYWISRGLEDRDDLRGWSTTNVNVVEIDGDPEGYDAD